MTTRRAWFATIVIALVSHRLAHADRCQMTSVELHVMEDPARYMEKVQAAIVADEKSGALKPNTFSRQVPVPEDPNKPGAWRDTEYGVTSLDHTVLLKYLLRLATMRSPAIKIDPNHRIAVLEGDVQDHPDQHAYTAVIISAKPVLGEGAFASFEPVTDASVGIKLTAAGGKAWAKATKAAIGHRMAVLVEGDAVTDLRIGGQVTSGVLKIYMPTKADAEALAKRIQTCR